MGLPWFTMAFPLQKYTLQGNQSTSRFCGDPKDAMDWIGPCYFVSTDFLFFFDAFILLAYIVPVSLVQTLHFVGPLVVGKPCLGSLVDYVFAAIRRQFHTAKNQILSRMSKNYIIGPPISASMLHMAIIWKLGFPNMLDRFFLSFMRTRLPICVSWDRIDAGSRREACRSHDAGAANRMQGPGSKTSVEHWVNPSEVVVLICFNGVSL